MHCAKNIKMTFQYSDVFLFETFSFIFGLGFDFGSDSCARKKIITVSFNIENLI